MKRKEVKDNYEIKKIFRKATQEDIEKWQDGRKLEQDTMMRARTIARALDLQMKISDVEYQGDKTKVTFFYTAEDRVDFRELIKKYAEEFRVRIEMRQIGYRVEAGRLGGIGSCGRELCCSSWLTDFRAVSTSAARYQQLSLNPTKLAGQCGKLKCCLNYELDQYAEALKDMPSTAIRLKLPKGSAIHFKTDIFKRTLYYIYEGQPGEAPFPLSVDAVKEIIEMNKKGIAIEDVEDFMEVDAIEEEATDFAQVVGQDSLTRFDQKRRGRSKSRRKPGGNEQREQQGQRPQRTENKQQQPKQERSNEPRPQGPKPPRPQQQRPPQQRQQGQQGQQGGQQERPQGEGNKPQGNKPRNNPRNNRNRGPRRDNTNKPPQEGGGQGA